jgi:hypothetical protein
MPNAYENQAFNGQPKPSTNGMQLGQSVVTSAGKGRIVNIEQAGPSGNSNPAFSSSLDPFLVTIVLDETQQVVTTTVSMLAFRTFNGALPFHT